MLNIIKNIIDTNSCKIRFNWLNDDSELETSPWVSGFGMPEDGYFEPSLIGPIKIGQLNWLEIDPVEIRKIGRLIPEKEIYHTEEVLKALEDNKIDFSFDGKLIRVDNKNFKPVSD